MKLFRRKDPDDPEIKIVIIGKHSNFELFQSVTTILQEALRKEGLFNGMVWSDYSDKNEIKDTLKILKFDALNRNSLSGDKPKSKT